MPYREWHALDPDEDGQLLGGIEVPGDKDVDRMRVFRDGDVVPEQISRHLGEATGGRIGL